MNQASSLMPSSSENPDTDGLRAGIYDALIGIERSGASGELIVVGDGGETQFYVVHGRIAWANSSSPTRSFATHIKSIGVDGSSLAAVMDECKTSRASFLSTLVAWEVATPQQVQEALFVQIGEALSWICSAERLEKLFVPRHLTYDKDQTFSIQEIYDGCMEHPTRPAYRQVATALKAAMDRAAKSDRIVASRRLSLSKNDTRKITKKPRRNRNMANTNEALGRLSEIDGSIGGCIVDSDSGMMLGSVGGGPVDLEIAAAGNTEVVRAKRKTMASLGLAGTIDDILITLEGQYHLIRPLKSNDALFFYLVLDRNKANLAMARHKLRDIAGELLV